MQSPVASFAAAPITRGSKVRFLRDGTIIWKGSIQSLKRFKEDAREVREGFECGIGLSDFQDLKPGDLIETFEEREDRQGLTHRAVCELRSQDFA